ncbi:MAG: glycosyltransferase family 2 protein, partial [Bacteroidetes bacterium]|nr:glycosyltransferase family 2 protein [Bacteroidota bacterium]
MSSRTKVIVVLPAFNEEKSLPSLLSRIDDAFQEFELKGEILVVNDGSQDRTSEICRGFQSSFPVEVVDVNPNKGLANAIKVGFLTALPKLKPNDILIVMDADNSHTPGLILRMTRLIHEGADVVIASRYRDGARIRGLTTFRKFLSWGASMLFRTLVGIPGVRDYTCGYRAYRAQILFNAMADYKDQFIQQSGFACMTEILLKLKKFDPIIIEVPLILRYDQKESESKMRV